MRSQPHFLLARYERLILRPLDFIYYALALYFFWHRAWIVGSEMVLISLGVDFIGQGLPHRKRETSAELAEGMHIYAGDFDGDIDEDEARGFGKAFSLTVVLVAATQVVIAIHENLSWYWMLLSPVLLSFAFAIIAMLIAISPERLIAAYRVSRVKTMKA